MDVKSRSTVRLRLAAEAIVLSMACLAPWAFGSVEAWAQLALALGTTLLVFLRLFLGLGTRFSFRQLTCAPSLALAGLALLAAFQGISMPAPILERLAPSTAHFRAELTPDAAQYLVGEPGSRISPPARTIALDAEAARIAAMQLAAAWVLFQCVIGLDAGFAFLRRFSLVTVANASLMGLFSLVQSLSWDGKIYGVRPSPITDGWYSGGPFVCHNHLAAYLNIALGCAIGLLVSDLREKRISACRTAQNKGHGQHLWIAYALAVIVVGIVSSHSRTGVLAMVGSAVVTLIFLRPTSLRIPPGIFAMLAIIPVLLIAVGSASSFQRLVTLTDSDSTGLNGRSAIWRRALATWIDHPILGIGFGSFEVASAMAPQPYLGVTYYHAENEYLEVLTEGGGVGMALLLVMLTGIVSLGHGAFVSSVSKTNRALVLGAMFSGVSLAIQCAADFPLHVPGVGVSAVVLFGLLSSLGLQAREQSATVRQAPLSFRPRGRSLVDLVLCGLSLAILSFNWNLARSEAMAAGTGLALPGSFLPGSESVEFSAKELERECALLERSLRFRPDWSEGYTRLGLIKMKLYQSQAASWLAPDSANHDEAAELADPLWLHGLVHSATVEELASFGGVTDQEPVRNYLVPAARNFLQARRCSPFRASTHTQLASLDYLIDKGEPIAVHIARALRLTGGDPQVTTLAAVLASQAGEVELAAVALRRTLELRGSEWATIADLAGNVLAPEEILSEVLPIDGGYEVRFADRLYSESDDQKARNLFLRAALERAPENAALTAAERQWIQGQAWARLDDRDQARKAMETALTLESSSSERRQEYIRWLLEWGQVEEANSQARLGLALDPQNEALHASMAKTVDAIARGGSNVVNKSPDGG